MPLNEKKKIVKEKKKKKKIHVADVLDSVREVRPEVDVMGQIHSYYKWAQSTDSYVQQGCVWG